MSKQPVKNLVASVHRRLVDLSRRRGEEANLTFARFVAERFLYRLSRSRHRERFILKGAMLFSAWQGYPNRPTRDVDLLGFGPPDPELLRDDFAEICSTPVEADGLLFDAKSVHVEAIRENDVYGGLRVRLRSSLGHGRYTLQVDVGIGDAVAPPPEEIDFPALLDFPAPRLRVYARETVIAEKLHAIVTLGAANSRMKDFFDLWTMSRCCTFSGPTLHTAVTATLMRRGTELPPGEPEAFADEFGADPSKRAQWSGFLKRTGLQERGSDLRDVVAAIRRFLLPVLEAIRAGESFSLLWPPNGPWRPSGGDAR